MTAAESSTSYTIDDLGDFDFGEPVIILEDEWRKVFDRYDPEGFGEMPIENLKELIQTEEGQAGQTDDAKEKFDILKRHFGQMREKNIGSISFQTFAGAVEIHKFY